MQEAFARTRLTGYVDQMDQVASRWSHDGSDR